MTEPLVVAESTEPVESEATVSAGPQSPLAHLHGKRADLDNQLFLDLAVPRWEEVTGRRMWVRYKPADAELFQADLSKREKAFTKAKAEGKRGDEHWMTKSNADMLVKSCVAVYDLALDEQPPKGEIEGLDEYPTFSSPELSEAVGAPASAVETAMKVYATDGDLMMAAAQLLEYSAKVSPQAESSFLDS